MSKYLSTVLFTLFLFNGCRGQQTKSIPIERDTTITPVTSYSALFLDSTKLESFINEHNTDDSASEQMRNFYKQRNYQFAWFTENGIAEHTRSFWNLHNNYVQNFSDTALKYKVLHQHIDQLLNDDTAVIIGTERMLKTELDLTMHFFAYSNRAYSGKLNPKELQWYIPRKKINVVELLDSLIITKNKNLQEWEPVNRSYQRLTKELVRYHQIDQAGGWKAMASDRLKKYRPGDSALLIKQVKQRLQTSGNDMTLDTSGYYTIELVPAITLMQRSFGLKEDGVITSTLIDELNVSVKD